MNPHDQHHDARPDPLTPELSALAAALDDLGRSDRAAAPPGLADRVYFRTAASLRAQPARAERRLAIGSFVRIAAVLALTTVGVIGVSRLARQHNTLVATDMSVLDAVLPADGVESWNPIASNALADVRSELDALESELDSFWSLDSNWLDDTSEGSL
ncbi:MAG: hypothetical protein H6812_08205 [Phycisphaeraceae bacterium]|nr:hypothetical protein [Phycisphaerales bacterium]MCB9843227.1 hypothetical protein [Phycisphaeraceae bacterium]